MRKYGIILAFVVVAGGGTAYYFAGEPADASGTDPAQPSDRGRSAAGQNAGGGGGFGGGGGGGGRGGGACQGGRTASVGTYRVTVSVGGKDVGSQTFRVLEDIWLNER
jgi:hypothetical protein